MTLMIWSGSVKICYLVEFAIVYLFIFVFWLWKCFENGFDFAQAM